MAKAKPLPDRDWLLSQLSYDHETGLFWWVKTNSGKNPSGLAGCKTYRKKDGKPHSIRITLQYRLYMAHRLAWLIMTSEDPGDLTVDHIDRNPFNNKFSNLRIADCRLQQRNKNSYGRSRHKGVRFHQVFGRWEATGWVDGRQKFLGRFLAEEEAAAAAAPYYIH